MRSSTARPPQRQDTPPGVPRRGSWRSRLRRFGAVLATTAVLASAAVVGTSTAALAASVGPGHGSPDNLGTLGSFIAESDGRQVYCMDAGAPAPWNMTTGPTTVTELVSNTGQQLSSTTLAKLNYVLSKWGDSTNPDITAAVQMYVWAEADPVTYNSHGMSGDSWYIGRVPAAWTWLSRWPTSTTAPSPSPCHRLH